LSKQKHQDYVTAEYKFTATIVIFAKKFATSAAAFVHSDSLLQHFCKHMWLLLWADAGSAVTMSIELWNFVLRNFRPGNECSMALLFACTKVL